MIHQCPDNYSKALFLAMYQSGLSARDVSDLAITQKVLNDIEANDYQVFARRAHVTGWGKLRRLPGIWWRARTGYG